MIHKELSYQIVGVAFEVYNSLGPGYHEKHYHRGFALGLQERGLSFKQEVLVPLHFKGNSVGRYYLDFLVEDKIVVELKKGDYFGKKNIDQVKSYLAATKLTLAILINFRSDGVKFMRVLNINSR